MPSPSSFRFWITATLLAMLAGAAIAMPAFVPAYERDFSDPFIPEHDGEYIAYSTNPAGTNLPMATSRDPIDANPCRDAGGYCYGSVSECLPTSSSVARTRAA